MEADMLAYNLDVGDDAEALYTCIVQ